MQGFDPKADVDWREAGLTASQFGGMVGNAQSLNVVQALMPHVLYHSKLITKEQFRRVQGRVFG